MRSLILIAIFPFFAAGFVWGTILATFGAGEEAAYEFLGVAGSEEDKEEDK